MFNKLITSSADPRALSLTVRGILVAILPVFLVVTGMDEMEANVILDRIVDIVFYGSALISVSFTAFGLIRKAVMRRWSAEE
jgi:hypothetical protein